MSVLPLNWGRGGEETGEKVCLKDYPWSSKAAPLNEVEIKLFSTNLGECKGREDVMRGGISTRRKTGRLM
jgi:hypothetical protein